MTNAAVAEKPASDTQTAPVVPQADADEKIVAVGTAGTDSPTSEGAQEQPDAEGDDEGVDDPTAAIERELATIPDSVKESFRDEGRQAAREEYEATSRREPSAEVVARLHDNNIATLRAVRGSIDSLLEVPLTDAQWGVVSRHLDERNKTVLSEALAENYATHIQPIVSELESIVPEDNREAFAKDRARSASSPANLVKALLRNGPVEDRLHGLKIEDVKAGSKSLAAAIDLLVLDGKRWGREHPRKPGETNADGAAKSAAVSANGPKSRAEAEAMHAERHPSGKTLTNAEFHAYKQAHPQEWS